MVGIIIALNSEYIFSKEFKKKIIHKKNNNQDFQIYDKKIVFTYSGIGKVNSAIASQNLVTDFKLRTLVDIGTAGALSKVLRVGELVFCGECFSYDVDLTAFNYKIGQIPREKDNFFSFEKSKTFLK